MEGTRLSALVGMAIPLCRDAERRCPRAGPGAPPTYPDWQMAVLIMIAVMMRRKSKTAQYLYLDARRTWLMRRLKMESFPSRTTYFDRYRRAHTLLECAVVLQGEQAIAEGIANARAVAVDKSLIPARGPVQHAPRWHRRRRKGADQEAAWGYSEHHGWVYGYSYESVVSASGRSVVMPLAVSAGPANVSEARSFEFKIDQLPAAVRYVLGDSAYDTNHYGERIERTASGQPTGRRLVCPLQSRAGKPAVGMLPHRGRRERLRQHRGERHCFFQSAQGRKLYARRRSTVEPFNEWFKAKFDLNTRVWHRGVNNNRTQIAAATFVYQLLIRYNHKNGKQNGCIKWILDTL